LSYCHLDSEAKAHAQYTLTSSLFKVAEAWPCPLFTDFVGKALEETARKSSRTLDRDG